MKQISIKATMANQILQEINAHNKLDSVQKMYRKLRKAGYRWDRKHGYWYKINE